MTEDVFKKIKTKNLSFKEYSLIDLQQIHKKTNYNVPMFILQNSTSLTKDILDICFCFYALKICDINYYIIVDEKVITIFSIFLEKASLEFEPLENIKTDKSKETQEIMKHTFRRFFNLLINNGYSGQIPLKKYPHLNFLKSLTRKKEFNGIIDRTLLSSLQNENVKSAFGDVFISFYEGLNNDVIIKYPKIQTYTQICNSDFYKEYTISKKVNNIFPNTTVEMYGFLITKSRKEALVMEYAPFTLTSILNILKNFSIQVKKDFVLKIFKDATTKLANFNECGFCHFDLKSDNIIVCFDMTVKLIDFGISCFVGLERMKLGSVFSCTSNVKAPDDIKDEKTFKKESEQNVFFYDSLEKTSSVNYSTDMFSLASTMFSYMSQEKLDRQFLMTKNKIYTYLNSCDRSYRSIREKFRELTNEELSDVDLYSKNFIDFFVRTTCHDSSIRYTSREALNHVVFGGSGITNLEVPFCVTEIVNIGTGRNLTRNQKHYLVNEIITRSNELKIYDRYLEIAKTRIIKSNVGMLRGSGIDSYSQQIPENDTERTQIQKDFLIALTEVDKKDYFNFLDVAYFSGDERLQSPPLKCKEIYSFIITCNSDIIELESLICSFITKKRIEGKVSGYDLSCFENHIRYYVNNLFSIERPIDVKYFKFFELCLRYEIFWNRGFSIPDQDKIEFLTNELRVSSENTFLINALI